MLTTEEGLKKILLYESDSDEQDDRQSLYFSAKKHEKNLKKSISEIEE